jgi:hypothetical protein
MCLFASQSSPAEHLSRAKLVDEDLLALGRAHLDRRFAFQEEEELIGRSPLCGQSLGGLELPDVGDPSDRLEICFIESPEDLESAKLINPA